MPVPSSWGSIFEEEQRPALAACLYLRGHEGRCSDLGVSFVHRLVQELGNSEVSDLDDGSSL